MVDYPRRSAARQGSAVADGRGVSQDPEHVPVSAVEPLRLRSGDRRGARGASMLAVDRYVLSRVRAARRRRRRRRTRHTTSRRSSTRINEFVTVDLSAFYLDVSKDRLYTFGATSRERRSAQTAQYRHRRRPGAAAWRRCCRSRPTRSGAAARARARRRCTWRCSRPTRPAGATRPLEDAGGNCSTCASASTRRSKSRGSARTSATRCRRTSTIVAGADVADLLDPVRGGPADAADHLVGRGRTAAATTRSRCDVSRAAGEKCPRCWRFVTESGSRRATLAGLCGAMRRCDWRRGCRCPLTNASRRRVIVDPAPDPAPREPAVDAPPPRFAARHPGARGPGSTGRWSLGLIVADQITKALVRDCDAAVRQRHRDSGLRRPRARAERRRGVRPAQHARPAVQVGC